MLFHVFCLHEIHHSPWPRTADQMLPSSESLCWCIFRQLQVWSMAWRAAVLTDVFLGFFGPSWKMLE
jgi:hypothetical protein